MIVYGVVSDTVRIQKIAPKSDTVGMVYVKIVNLQRSFSYNYDSNLFSIVFAFAKHDTQLQQTRAIIFMLRI